MTRRSLLLAALTPLVKKTKLAEALDRKDLALRQLNACWHLKDTVYFFGNAAIYQYDNGELRYEHRFVAPVEWKWKWDIYHEDGRIEREVDHP